jgi:hypothetical protein
MPSCKFACRLAGIVAISHSPNIQMHILKDSKSTLVLVISVDNITQGLAFLASDKSKMINGALILIDNAWSTI